MNHRSLTFRLVAWYCGLLLVIGMSFAAFTYAGFTYFLHGTMQSTLATRTRDMAALATPLLDDPAKLSEAMLRRFSPEDHSRFMRILLDDETVYRSGQPITRTYDAATVDANMLQGARLQNRGSLWIYRTISKLSDGRSLTIESGQLDDEMEDARRGLVRTLLIALPALLLIAAVGGYWLVRNALAPVADMMNAAEALTFNSPDKRLPLAGTGDLFDEFVKSLNRMLDRLDHAYQHANRFSADAAHELRTPLAIMRGELEFIAPHHQLSSEVSAAATSALDEAVRMSHLLENLMTLAVIDGTEIYGDDTLNRLETLVDTANPTLAASAAAYERARSLAAEASAGLYPTVQLDGTLSRNKQSVHRPLNSTAEPIYYGANTIETQASYEIDLWGRVRNAVAAAKAQTQASAADLESVRLMLHAEVAADYAGLRGMDEEAKLLADTLSAYAQAYDLTKAMYEGKIASPIDVSRAATQLHDAEAQISDITSRRALLEHAIAELVGKAPADETLAATPVHVRVPDVPTGVPSTILQRRPDIASAERKVAAANAQVGIARAAFYPALSIGASAGFQDLTLNLLHLPDSLWSVGPTMALPLFEGGLRRAALREARAAFEESADDYRATVLKAFREVEDNLALLHWLNEQERQEDAAAHAAQDTVDMTTTLYSNGAESYLEVVTAQTAALNAQRAVIALQTRRVQASVGLIRALGGGWSTENSDFSKTAANL